MGFQNKFYNASKKDPGQASSAGVAEYRINVSSDTPHWYIRDYLARVSRHYDISAIEVDGNTVTLLQFFDAITVTNITHGFSYVLLFWLSCW